MWRYVQRTGEVYAASGELLAVGYAGRGPAKNRPESQADEGDGPLPCGDYTIQAPRDRPDGPGPYFLPLVPDLVNAMYGRSGFGIHGDSIKRPGWASHGCIVLDPSPRRTMWNSGDRLLRVVAERVDL